MATAEDDKIWSAYARGVKQIAHAPKSPAKPKKDEAPEAKPARGFRMAAASLKAPQASAMKKGKPFQELLDRRTERQLKQGGFVIEARLDLHGRTQDEAYVALERFLETQIKTGNRNLLIITGKGRDGKGALRANLVHWLETFSSASEILGLRPAAPKHGGDGAFYLILRRRKQ